VTTVNQLFGSELKVVNIGLASFKQALDAVGAPVVQVDWRPPVDVDAALVKQVNAALPAIEKANAQVMKIILGGMPQLIGMERAIDVIPGMKPNMLLHAGPPITWERMCGPMRGAVIGALLYEAEGQDPRGARSGSQLPVRSSFPPATNTPRSARWLGLSRPRCLCSC
jgi:hypothetical protein